MYTRIAIVIVLVAVPTFNPRVDGGTNTYIETGTNCDKYRYEIDNTILDWPVQPYNTTQYFIAGHPALDISLKLGTPVFSAGSGIIKEVGYYPNGYGFFIVISHADGWETRYAHLMQRPELQENDRVDNNQLIGYAGSTGQATGTHLHFEMMKDGCFIDPEIIDQQKVTDFIERNILLIGALY